MWSHDLHEQYRRLRADLEAAYRAPVWDSRLIDRLADALARLERRAMPPLAGLAAPFSSWPKAAPDGSMGRTGHATPQAGSR